MWTDIISGDIQNFKQEFTQCEYVGKYQGNLTYISKLVIAQLDTYGKELGELIIGLVGKIYLVTNLIDTNNLSKQIMFSDKSSSIALSINNISDVQNIHRAIMCRLDPLIFTEEINIQWSNLNIIPYSGIGSDIPESASKGFVRPSSQISLLDDKMDMYEEFILHVSLSKKYDPIINSKFKLLFNRLGTHNPHWEGLINKANINFGYIFPPMSPDTKLTYILDQIEYTLEEDMFVANFKPELANQAEKERFMSLLKDKYILDTNPKYIHESKTPYISAYILARVEPLVLVKDLVNNMAHIFGMASLGSSYKIPQYTGSPISRIIHHSVECHIVLVNDTITITNPVVLNSQETQYQERQIAACFRHIGQEPTIRFAIHDVQSSITRDKVKIYITNGFKCPIIEKAYIYIDTHFTL